MSEIIEHSRSYGLQCANTNREIIIKNYVKITSLWIEYFSEYKIQKDNHHRRRRIPRQTGEMADN